MVMEELGERETIVEGSRRRRGAQVAVTEVTQVVEIFKESALGRFFHRVAMSVYVFICFPSPFHVIFFEASHWPSGHMIRSRPLIGRPPLLIVG